MGQYYKPINIETMEWLYSHNYKNGLKLMEHSYIGNNFVGVVMKLLTKGNKWHKKPIVWCGDYYEEKPYYDEVKDENKLNPKEYLDEKEQEGAILVNHTKKEYVLYSMIKKMVKDKVVQKLDGVYEFIINPLPLLTALGNGNGGGDYNGVEMDKIGIWAGDILSVEFKIPEDYKELKVNFKEGK